MSARTETPGGGAAPGKDRAAAGLEQLLTTDELATHLGVSVTALRNWRRKGTGPRAVRIVHQLRYRASDVEAWLRAQEVKA